MANRTRVAVGISGGVDSTMAAKLLLEKGYEVIGLTMSIWDGSVEIGTPTKSGCFGPGEKDDLKTAAEVCQRLGIEHHVIKLQKEYKDNVLNYFCATYLDGKTPNPCLMCNQRLKFGLLPEKAHEQGIDFDYFATGHYARIEYCDRNRRWRLKRALDLTKDQSYFLSYLSQEQLSKLIFPLGELTKQEIKELASKCGFGDLAVRQESQDFLETDDYSVLFDKDAFQAGDIVDIRDRVLGRHKGLIHYTIGQRKNLGIPGQTEPFYVIDIDNETNRLIAGPQRYLYGIICKAVNLNWVSIEPPDRPFWTKAKIRLQHEPADCYVSPMKNNCAEVNFEKLQLSITPGQGIVFYNGDTVYAGAIIDKI
ncbi:MAG: tRNA 2-thiouridine(34) synthase MnmA [Candidatus Cloacimonadaceae bacterium]